MGKKKTALLTGVTGQDGSYLSEHLVNAGYDVHGVMRRSSSPNSKRIDHVFNPEARDKIHYGNLIGGLDNLIYEIQPDVIYNLAAQSQVWISFKEPVYTGETNAIGVTKLLETVRQAEQTLDKKIKVYQASSSEMFGTTPAPQSETSLFQPVSPYGAAKLYSYWMMKCYRRSYNMHCTNGILFNHESPRRGETFVTKKIVKAAARIKFGLQKELTLGNLHSKRDWGHSKDYTKAMMLMMEHDTPGDWVVSTGEYHSVKEFVDEVCGELNMDLWKHIKILKELERPLEVPELLGDSTKIRTELGWKPEYNFKALVKEMIDYEIELASKEQNNEIN